MQGLIILIGNQLQYIHLWVVGILLFCFAAAFVFRFWIPAIKLGSHLRAAINSIKIIQEQSSDKILNLEAIANEAMAAENNLRHQWSEYRETLHPQTFIDEVGNEKIGEYRATAMAEIFFSEYSIVNTPLKTEFYKHLPGILTGLGIIGTFLGLITGLIAFSGNPMTTPEAAQQSLKVLIGSVGHAFCVSGLAITLAMICTWIEKFVVTSRYREVEELCHLIDSLFNAGAGEEYLSRLVKASESSATQSAQIKDSLVTDLKQILSELSNKELEAAAKQNELMTGTLADAFAKSMNEPLAQISQAVSHVGSNQGDAVTRLLTDVLVNFSSQMKDMFGGQMTGLNSALQESIRAMQTTVARFDDLAGNLQGAGKNAAETMANQLEEAMKGAQVRQELMNRQMSECVEAIRSLVSESQTEASNKTQEVLRMLSEKVGEVVGTLQTQAENANVRQENRENQLAEHAQSALTNSSELLHALTQEVASASSIMKSSVAQLSDVTRDSIQKLNSGAETLYIAASEFSKAGVTVNGTLNSAVDVAGKFQVASVNLVTASNGVQGVLEDYKKTRDIFAMMVSDLKNTVDTAKREASMTTELVSKLQAGASALGTSNMEAERYLNGVSAVIAQVHQDFASNLNRTLTEGNGKFHTEVAQAAGFLSGSMQQLGDTLDSVLVKLNRNEQH